MGEALPPLPLLCLQSRLSHSQGRTQTALICPTPILLCGLEAISGTHITARNLCLSPFPPLCTVLLTFTMLCCAAYSSTESHSALSHPLVAFRSSWQNLTCFLALILPGQRQVASSDLPVSYMCNSGPSSSPGRFDHLPRRSFSSVSLQTICRQVGKLLLQFDSSWYSPCSGLRQCTLHLDSTACV